MTKLMLLSFLISCAYIQNIVYCASSEPNEHHTIVNETDQSVEVKIDLVGYFPLQKIIGARQKYTFETHGYCAHSIEVHPVEMTASAEE
ncbi:hypothetical protein KG892_03080 [Vermiphilus pyriformis]|nr:MAG: hypothetical protein KG892_03080 [Vermiphilus pyriformis]